MLYTALNAPINALGERGTNTNLFNLIFMKTKLLLVFMGALSIIACDKESVEAIEAVSQTTQTKGGSKLTAKIADPNIGFAIADPGTTFVAADFYFGSQHLSGGQTIEVAPGNYQVNYSATLYREVELNGIDISGDVATKAVSLGNVRGTISVEIAKGQTINLLSANGQVLEALFALTND